MIIKFKAAFISLNKEEINKLNSYFNKNGLKTKVNYFMDNQVIFAPKRNYYKTLFWGSIYSMQHKLYDIKWIARNGNVQYNMYDLAKTAKDTLQKNGSVSYKTISALHKNPFSTKDIHEVQESEFI